MDTKRLLIVDDESVFLRALKKVLQTPDVEVDTAETLVETRVLLRRHAYDIVLADLRLAGTEGQEGLDIIRTVKENRPVTKVILMTAYGDNEVRLKASFLGADMYLEKPVPIEIIREGLEDQVRRQVPPQEVGDGHPPIGAAILPDPGTLKR